jgi:hypothetical protein
MWQKLHNFFAQCSEITMKNHQVFTSLASENDQDEDEGGDGVGDGDENENKSSVENEEP